MEFYFILNLWSFSLYFWCANKNICFITYATVIIKANKVLQDIFFRVFGQKSVWFLTKIVTRKNGVQCVYNLELYFSYWDFIPSKSNTYRKTLKSSMFIIKSLYAPFNPVRLNHYILQLFKNEFWCFPSLNNQ